MSGIHKTCYRCDQSVRDLVDPTDVLGGQHGVCDDCRLTLASQEVARDWHRAHDAGVGLGDGAAGGVDA